MSAGLFFRAWFARIRFLEATLPPSGFVDATTMPPAKGAPG
jgi:hypothetical protein